MNTQVRVLAILFSALLIITGSRLLIAQSGAGSIQGTVQDATHAVIPGATIQVVNQATGVATNTKSNGVGFYQVPGLFVGHYTVRVSAPGMKTYETSIELLVAQNAVINPVLTPGAVTQQITVKADTVQLTTPDSGNLVSTLENERINQLPQNGRNLLTLIGYTTAGMEDSGQKVNGLGVNALEYVIDGTPTKNDLKGGESNFRTQLIDPDSIQEVRMEATNAGAQFATPATGIVTTKSGTNALHGTFFETARNNAFGVARRIQDPVNYSAPHLVRNEFGASAGGPIILPHIYHGKNRSFWFFAYERYSLASTNTTLTKVPTMAMRQGDFSGLVNGKGVLQVLYDPASTHANSACPVPGTTQTVKNPYCRTPFRNNTIPLSQISPVAKLAYQLIPQPTTDANPLVQGNMIAESPEFQVQPQETFRLDHEFNENNRAYLRFTHNYSNVNTSGGPRNLAVGDIPVGGAFGYSNNPSNSFLAAIGYTHIFSPTFFSETIVSQQWFSDIYLPGVSSNLNYESMLNLPNNFGSVGFPDLGNGSLIFDLGTSQTNNIRFSQIISNLDENLTKTVGRHQFLFGGRFRHDRDGILSNGIADYIDFDRNPAALYNPKTGANYTPYPNVGFADASFFLGSASTYNVNLEPPYVHFRTMEFDGYFQDNYHVSRNLTVNMGLRYESHPAIWQQDHMGASFDLKNDAEVLAATPAQLIAEGLTTQAVITNDKDIGIKFETPQEAGMPSGLMKNYSLVLLPRFGIAYLPFNNKWQTVIRGGYGRYDFPDNLQAYVTVPPRSNPFIARYYQRYESADQAIDDKPNELLRYNDPAVFGVAGKNTANAVDSTSVDAVLPGVSPYFVSPNWAPKFATETNVTIEQPIKGWAVVRASYEWTHATNLDLTMYPNNHPSKYQWEMTTGTIPPTGGANVIGTPAQNTYAATATGPYDQTTWGSFKWVNRSGWSNYNAFLVTFQRLFHRGYAYQLTYVYSKTLVANGSVDPIANYPGILGTVSTMTSPYGTFYPGNLPPARPAGTPVWAQYHALTGFEQYQQDSAQPTMHIRFNWVVDLPVGRGKRFFGHVNRFVNEVIGGFQLAGDGNIFSGQFQVDHSMWGPAVSPLKIYKHKMPITDCKSGVCEKGYMWFNGYQAPTVTTGVAGSVCVTNCITGIPSGYQPIQTPIDNTPGTTYYGSNNVQVSSPALLASNGGEPVTIGYDAGPQAANYLAQTWLHGPINWPIDISIFKVFPITEKTNLRINMDAFNAFNMPGENNPGSDGVQTFLTSHNTPRQIQLTARFTF